MTIVDSDIVMDGQYAETNLLIAFAGGQNQANKAKTKTHVVI